MFIFYNCMPLKWHVLFLELILTQTDTLRHKTGHWAFLSGHRGRLNLNIYARSLKAAKGGSQQFLFYSDST